MLSFNSSSANRRLFCSDPLVHCALEGCLTFRIRQGTSMSHQGHHGWGRFTSAKMTMVSRTCRCQKCTRIAVLVAASPGHPSIGQLYGPPLAGKSMQYVRVSSPVAEVFQLLLYSAAHPCCVILCPAKYPAAISSLHSLHCTRPFCRSW